MRHFKNHFGYFSSLKRLLRAHPAALPARHRRRRRRTPTAGAIIHHLQ